MATRTSGSDGRSTGKPGAPANYSGRARLVEREQNTTSRVVREDARPASSIGSAIERVDNLSKNADEIRRHLEQRADTLMGVWPETDGGMPADALSAGQTNQLHDVLSTLERIIVQLDAQAHRFDAL